jgi:hypothetical protein
LAEFKRKISRSDWKVVGEYITAEVERRANKRRHLDQRWKEIDRQLEMDAKPKVDEDGQPLSGSGWMSSLELPNQASALEILNADARRLMFPTDRNFFSAHAAMDDAELEKLENTTLIPGLSENSQRIEQLGSKSVTQDDLDAVIEGVLTHHHVLGNFRAAWDNLNAEAFKYGTHVGFMRPVAIDKFDNQFRGITRNTKRVPVLIPQSIKNTYLDDSFTATMHEGLMIGPSTIYSYWHTLDDLRLAAAKGSTDPTKSNGGWMAGGLRGMEPLSQDTRSIQIFRFEGDLHVPRSSGPAIFVPNVLIWVAVGKRDSKFHSNVFRFQEQEFPFRATVSQPYHQEDINSPYGTSPLMKGMPVQAAASEALNKMMDAGSLSVQPPVRYSPQDHYLEAMGGPQIYPGARYKSISGVEMLPVGDPGGLFQIYLGLLGQYADVTGISAPRLGAQTKSHQTAFAIDTEQTRGVVRTVDYVRSVNDSSMLTVLNMEYEMIRRLMKEELIYIPKWQQYVQISGSLLPARASFDVHGAGGPIEEQEKMQKRNVALQQAVQLEQARRQMGEQGMDLEATQKQILEDGGWLDVDRFFESSPEQLLDPSQAGPAVPGSPGVISEEPLGALAALQAQAG